MLVPFTIDDSTWDHISTICAILKVFEGAITQLQGDTYETSILTISYVCGVSKPLEKWVSDDVAKANHLIALGLQEARKKLLQYCPVHSDDIEPLKGLHLATVLDPHMQLGVFRDLGLANSGLIH